MRGFLLRVGQPSRDSDAPRFFVGPAVSVSGTDITFTATTSENTDFGVELWVDDYGSRLSVWWYGESESVHSHAIGASDGVLVNTDYSDQIVVRDGAGNVTTSTVGTFTTFEFDGLLLGQI